MRRDRVSVEFATAQSPEGGEPTPPGFLIRYDGPEAALATRFLDPVGSPYTPDLLDVFVREQSPDATSGVFCISDRLTGAILLESTVSMDLVVEFGEALRQFGESIEGTIEYRIGVRVRGMERAEFCKSTFLVYGQDGGLIRRWSIIPAGIEI